MEDITGIPITTTPVLIIGSSMVGMTLSALLAKHGIRDCLTVEKHSSTAIHPRAALFHPRTMQIYRELGLYEQMKEESYKHYDRHAGLHNVESLAGKKLQTFMQNINEGLGDISPTSRLFLTQQMFEPLLREHARGHGAEMRFSTEVVGFQQDEGGVTALIRDLETGEKQLIRAQYLVGCDGSRSFVREKLGIQMQGHGLLSHSLTIYFKADLGRFVQGKYNGVIYVNNEDVRGFFRLDKTGREGFLVVNTAGERGTEESRFPGKDITNERASEMLRAAIGADVDFEITLLSPWQARCDVAERFIDGRIFLAGDACHLVTPHGGFGGNTGIHDAHNLAWKLALVLQGKAKSDLLVSYEEERRSVAKKTVDQVFERYIVRTAPEFRQPHMDVEEEVPEPHIELGYQYTSRGLTNKTLPNGGGVTSDPATAKAVAGTMAHHVLIQTLEAENRLSKSFPIADLLGNSFVLLCGHDATGWVRAARNLNYERSETLPSLAIHQLAPDGNAAFYDKYALMSVGCVLIRPDGFIAWSEPNAAVTGFGAVGMPAPEDRLKCVMEDVLCISSPPPRYTSQQGPEISKVVSSGSVSSRLFWQRKVLEKERAALTDRVREVEERLGDVERIGKLQDEMAMLAMKMKMGNLQHVAASDEKSLGSV